jgi:hypothetical protein
VLSLALFGIQQTLLPADEISEVVIDGLQPNFVADVRQIR